MFYKFIYIQKSAQQLQNRFGPLIRLAQHRDRGLSQNLPLHLHNQFDADLSRTIPFAIVYRKPKKLLTMSARFTQCNISLFCMEYQPCFAFYLTEQLIHRYIRPDMPNYKKNVLDYNDQLKYGKCVVVREPGLIREFEDFSDGILLSSLVYTKKISWNSSGNAWIP